MSNAPYQIKRVQVGKDYCYVLYRADTGKELVDVTSRSPVAPQSIRNYQARLNSKAMLDGMGVL